MRVGVVLNPAAGGGRMRLEWPFFRQVLEARPGGFDLRQTQRAGEAAALAVELAHAGADIVVAAGGDGTVGEVADGLLGLEAARRPALGVIPVGTGSDFARALSIPRVAADWARALDERASFAIDAGRVSFLADDGRPVVRHFASIASLGVSGEIDRVINAAAAKKKGRMSGKALFFFYTLRELMRYRFREVTVAVDDQPPIEARIALIAVANNRSFGGGMKIAPDAVMDDGLFDIVVVRGTSRLQLMKDLRLVYSGAHVGLESCTIVRGQRVTVTPRDRIPLLLDMDGEAPGRAPATFEVLPGALQLAGALRPS